MNFHAHKTDDLYNVLKSATGSQEATDVVHHHHGGV